jgi:hypothetical protein
MANPSKSYRWIIQVLTSDAKAEGKWYDVDAYRQKDEAEAHAELCRKRVPKAEWRVIRWEEK